MYKYCRLFICLLVLGLPFALKGQQLAVGADGKPLSVAQCLEKAAEQADLGNYRQASWFTNQAAMRRWEEKSYAEAIQYFEQSVALNEKVDNAHGIIGIYSNMAMIYADMKQYERSLDYFQKTLAGRKKGGDKVSVISALINASVVLNNLKRYNEAAVNLEEALSLSREINDPEQMRSCYGMLSETYEKGGNTERSLHYFDLYRTFHEMVQRDREQDYKEREQEAQMRAQLLEAESKAQELEMILQERELERKRQELQAANEVLSQFDATSKKLYESMDRQQLLEKVLQVTKHEREEDAELHALKLQQQRYIQYFLIAGVLGVVAVLLVLYKNYREKQASNVALSEKNQEILAQREHIAIQKEEIQLALTELTHKNQRITQSINYAQRIQTAMMPSEEDLLALFPSYAHFFQPRDIVSGDFCWCASLEGVGVLAVADCTGHGVPGALVSMVGMNLLDQIVLQEKMLDPGQILSHLHQGVYDALNQGQNQTQDGMDMALAVFDWKEKVIRFAGAKNPLTYVHNGVLKQLSPNKKPIGGSLRKEEKERIFDTKSIPMKLGMRVYLASDGYQDQFGGKQGRKFMSKRFRELLEETSQLPMKEQEAKIAQTFNDWKGDMEQVDDVLVMGIEITDTTIQK